MRLALDNQLGGDSVAAFDVSDPSRPVPIGEALYSPDAHRGCARCVGALAMVPGGVVGARAAVGGMVVFDPDAPGQSDVILATHEVAGSQEGGLDLAAAPPTALAPSGRPLDIAIPLGPPDEAPDVALADRFAIVAFEPATLVVVDVADPARPAIVAALPLDNQSATEVKVAWPHAIVAGGYAVSLVDLTEPSRPTVLDRLELPGRVQAMTLVGDQAWIVASEAGLVSVGWGRRQ